MVWLLTRLRIVLDTPNDRSLHHSPKPRAGGLGLLSGVALGAIASVGVLYPVIWIALGLALLSFIDDRGHLPVLIRLSGHVLASVAVVFLIGDRSHPVLLPFFFLGLAWMTNLYNFMDGADGLAGGMTVFGFVAYALAAGLQGHHEIGLVSICVAAAAAGFLVFNFPPARIFLGDVGSIPIGFLAGALGFQGWRAGAWPIVFPVVVFAPFILDATVTLVRRAIRNQPVWRAHRGHYYQRLILSGWTHRRTALVEYALMAVCAVAGIYMVFSDLSAQFMVAGVLAILLIALMAVVDRRCPVSESAK